MAIDRVSKDPVQVYYGSLETLHAHVRKNAPFTYIAYRSILPKTNEDFIDVAYKIAYFVTFSMLIQIGVQFLSPLCGIVPFLPFLSDLVWAGHLVLSRQGSPLTTLFFSSLGLGIVLFLDRIPYFG